MSSERLNNLLAAIRSDPSLKARLAASTTLEEAVAVCQSTGLDIVVSDLLEARKLEAPELSDAELEAVSGGGSNEKWIGSCGGSCDSYAKMEEICC